MLSRYAELLDQLRTVRVDPFRELPEPIPFLAPGEKGIHDVFDRLDGFVPNETDQRDRTRQFRDSLQLCGQYMLDGTGTIRWAHVEGGSESSSRGQSGTGNFSGYQFRLSSKQGEPIDPGPHPI